MEANALTQRELGELLHVEQQNVSGILAGRGASWPTATAFAQHLGYVGIDEYFVDHGVQLGRRPQDAEASPDRQHADAQRHARAIGVSERAIALVDRRTIQPGVHSSMWWVRQYMDAQDALDEARRELGAEVPGAPESKPVRKTNNHS